MQAKRILVADDDQTFLRAVKLRLESEGYDVKCVSDSYQALHFAVAEIPDLLILDVNMPAGKGFSVQQRLAEQDSDVRDIPVIYVTGEKFSNVDETAEACGAFAIIHKPFEVDEFLQTVRSALGFWDPEKGPSSRSLSI